MVVAACLGGGLVSAWERGDGSLFPGAMNWYDAFCVDRRGFATWGGTVGLCVPGRVSAFCSRSCGCSSVIPSPVHVHVLCSWLHPLPVSHNSHPNPACISHTTQPQTAKHAQAPISIPSSCDQAHIEQTPRTVSAGRAPMPDRCQSTCLSARCWDGRHLR